MTIVACPIDDPSPLLSAVMENQELHTGPFQARQRIIGELKAAGGTILQGVIGGVNDRVLQPPVA